ncbi:Aminotransferase, class I/classII [Cynara cardunculus var. scolymus]|uniref:Aminotransferase, class I/classII n=1 Tax=Cynara cardunculus var. scolymus TaxID=59895 RepID=A0A103Y857_CYNCS|nr:Aminotransferase, class I/classII [Cynara cardunculus var. scolymus]
MEKQEWGFKENHEVHATAALTMRNILEALIANMDENGTGKSMIHLGHGDPSIYPCFRTSTIVEDALVEATRSAKFNCYAPGAGIAPARRDLPYKLTSNDVFLTVGADHAIEVLLTVLARPGANILFPRPNYPTYEAEARFSPLKVRHYDLLPEKGWEVDLDGVKALADDQTVAIVLINPGNPCGNIAETARKLGILVIADEVYAHQVFGENPFIPMGVFGDIAPVVTVGTLSKRWIVPGWRLGWIAITDPIGILQQTGVFFFLPHIIENTPHSFFLNINKLLKEAADMLYKRLKEIPLVSCPYKPEGSMGCFWFEELGSSEFCCRSKSASRCNWEDESVLLETCKTLLGNYM